MTTIVCSVWAASAPSAVLIVQPSPPSTDLRAAGAEDRLDRDDQAGVQTRSSARSGALGTDGSSWIVRPMPWPPSSSSTDDAAGGGLAATASLIARTGAPATAAASPRASAASAAETSRRAARRAGPTDDGDAGVGVEAVELGRDVELDDVAAAQPPRAGHAVHRLVVDADEHLRGAP